MEKFEQLILFKSERKKRKSHRENEDDYDTRNPRDRLPFKNGDDDENDATGENWRPLKG